MSVMPVKYMATKAMTTLMGMDQCDDDRRPEVEQEQEQHQYGQRRAGKQVVEHRVDDDAYIVALVHQFHERQPIIFRAERVSVSSVMRPATSAVDWLLCFWKESSMPSRR